MLHKKNDRKSDINSNLQSLYGLWRNIIEGDVVYGVEWCEKVCDNLCLCAVGYKVANMKLQRRKEEIHECSDCWWA